MENKNTKALLIHFINYCRDNHLMPILHDDIEPLADDYLKDQLIQKAVCTTPLPIAQIYSFAETLAKGDHEWRYSDKDNQWHKDGWVSRTTDELMQLFPERL